MAQCQGVLTRRMASNFFFFVFPDASFCFCQKSPASIWHFLIGAHNIVRCGTGFHMPKTTRPQRFATPDVLKLCHEYSY